MTHPSRAIKRNDMLADMLKMTETLDALCQIAYRIVLERRARAGQPSIDGTEIPDGKDMEEVFNAMLGLQAPHEVLQAIRANTTAPLGKLTGSGSRQPQHDAAKTNTAQVSLRERQFADELARKGLRAKPHHVKKWNDELDSAGPQDAFAGVMADFLEISSGCQEKNKTKTKTKTKPKKMKNTLTTKTDQTKLPESGTSESNQSPQPLHHNKADNAQSDAQNSPPKPESDSKPMRVSQAQREFLLEFRECFLESTGKEKRTRPSARG